MRKVLMAGAVAAAAALAAFITAAAAAEIEVRMLQVFANLFGKLPTITAAK